MCNIVGEETKMKTAIVVCMISFFITTSGIPILAGIMMNNPPNTPSDPHPTDGETDIGVKTHLSWTGGDPDPGDKAVYDLYFGITSEPELLAINLQMPTYYPGVLQNNTQYFWKIVARDESQTETSGPVWTFTTNDCDCNPPEKPEGQNQVRHRNRYEYTTRVMNMNQNGLYYQFSWGDGNESAWIGPYNNNERVRAEYQWTEAGTYHVQARARFQNNMLVAFMDEWIYTGWSEPLIVTVTAGENTAPSPPSIRGMQTGKIGVSYEYTFTTTDAEGDEVYYWVDWGDGSNSGWSGPYLSNEMITLTKSWDAEGTYFIRAKAKDVSGSESNWTTLGVVMPKTYDHPFQHFIERIFEWFFGTISHINV